MLRCSCIQTSALGTWFSLCSAPHTARLCCTPLVCALECTQSCLRPYRQVHATLLHTGGDSSRSVGDALCRFVAKLQPAALVLMKENKSAVVQFFLGSVSRFCAAHSTAPVIIVPA
jgi:hypothetical protein